MHHSPPFRAPPRPSEPCPAPQSDGAGCAICCCCCETASWSAAPATQGCASPATQWFSGGARRPQKCALGRRAAGQAARQRECDRVNLRRHRGGTLKWLPTQLPAPVRPNRAHRWRRARRPRTAPSSMSRAAASATTCPGPARLRAPPHPLPPISPRAGRAPPDRGRAARTGARILPRPGRGCHTPPRHRHLGPAPARRRTGSGGLRKHLPRPCQI